MVYHRSKNITFDFSGADGFNNFHFAAFYADCQHEIKPVTKGHRLCLVYNLVYTGFGDCPAPQNNDAAVSSLVSAIKEWSADADAAESPPMMCYMLEHKYCEASLSFQLLKNTDRAVSSVLMEARKEVDFDLYVGQINLTENWSAESDYGCRWGRWGGCDCGDGDHEAIDLIEDSSEAVHLKSPEGHSITCINAEKEYFVPEDFFDDIDPDKEEYEEATGNEGATLDKQYNWSAFLIWPTGMRATNIGASNMISKLSLDLAAPAANKDEFVEVARGILYACARGDSAYHLRISAEKYKSLFQSLLKIGNTELVLDGLKFILGSSSSVIAEPSFADNVVHIGNTYGWNVLVAPFAKVSASTEGIGHLCKFLNCILGSQPSGVKKSVCLGLGRAIISALPASQPVSYYYSSRGTSPVSYESLLESLLKIGDAVLISEGLKSILHSSSSSLLSQTSFGDKILAVGRTFGWSVLKPPLEAGFIRMSTSGSGFVDCCKLLGHVLGSQPSDAQKDLCKGLTNSIIRVLSGGQLKSTTAESCESLFQILLKIGEASLILEGLKFALTSCFDSLITRASFSEKVLTIGRSCGWNVLKAPLEDSFRKLKPGSKLVAYCKFLKRIYGAHPSDAQKDVCRGLAGVVVTVLSTETDTKSSNRDKEFLFLLFEFLLTLGDSDTLLTLVRVIVTKPNCYPLFDILIPVCEKFASSGNDSFKLLFAHCIACLESSCSFPCSYDYSQPVVFSCSCNDCVLAMQFLKNSTQVTQSFRMQLHRRTHIESQLKYKKCSVTCATVRVGSPHTLVVTKTMSAGQKAAQSDKLKKSTLSRLRGLPPSSSGQAGNQQKPSSSSGTEVGVVVGSSSSSGQQQQPSGAATELPSSSSGPAAGVAIGPSSSIGSAKKRRESFIISLPSSGSGPTSAAVSSSGNGPAEKRQKTSDVVIDLT